ncbi:MAG TPA: MDR family MFS transporter [Thermomicrobiales bacterium]|nr:MDR family MFS transporter [Thermomicrobiales bacterium]
MSQAQAPAQATVGAAAAEPESWRATADRRRLVMVVVGVMLGMLLSALDQTVVGTAMPRIIGDLNGLEHYAWVFTAYMLASTVMVPIYGKLSDIYGRRLFFVGGMAIFLVGSALSGMSQNMTQLILFRAIQGLGAGAMMPIAQAIIGDVFPPSERGKWQGVMMAVFGLATIIGPTLGGWLTDNWGWRWVFYVNMPVGVIAIATAGVFLPGHSRHRAHQIDYLGSAALIAATVPLLLAFSWAGTQYAWGSAQIVGLLVFAAVMTAVFLVLETRAAEPIIGPSLFKNSIFTVSVIATFLVSVGMFGATMYLPLFVQGVIGTSATASGAVLTPMMLGFMVSSVIGGQLMSRTGKYRVLALIGFAVAAFGMVLLARMDVTATNALVVRNMVIVGLGIGVMMSLFTIIVQNAFPYRQLGEVTANLSFFRSIGGTIGVAVLGTVMTNRFQNTFAGNLSPALKQAVPPDRLAALQNPQVLLSPAATEQIKHAFDAFGPQGQALFAQLMLAIRESLATAITSLFVVSAVAMVLGFAVTLFLKEIPLRKGHESAPAIAGEGFAAGPGERVAGNVAAMAAPPRARFDAVAGLVLALVAREAERPDASPHLLASLSSTADGQYPHEWSAEERGRAIAREVIAPLAVALLRSATTDPARQNGHGAGVLAAEPGDK